MIENSIIVLYDNYGNKNFKDAILDCTSYSYELILHFNDCFMDYLIIRILYNQKYNLILNILLNQFKAFKSSFSYRL